MNFKQRCSILDQRIRSKKQENGLCFILCDKFGRALRNSLSHIPSLTPDIVIAERGNQNSEFVLENTGDMIGSRHYLENGDIFFQRLTSRVDLGKGRIFSWVPKKQLSGIGIPLCENDEIRGYVENKTNLSSILGASGVDVLSFSLKQDTFESRNHIPDFLTLVREYGLPFVLQGWSKGGDGTIIVKGEADFCRKDGLSGSIRVSEFCDKQYSSIYACIIPTGIKGEGVVVMDRPSFKVIGVSENGISDVFGGGCDWSNVPDIDMEETLKNVEKIGLYLLRQFGYKGALMLEGFFINGKFVFNELNARLGGGNEVSGFNQVCVGEIPIQAVHYALQLGIPCDDLIQKDEFHEKHFDSQKGGCFYIKVVGKNNQNFQVGNLFDGVYSLTSDTLFKIEPSRAVHTVNLDTGKILLSNLPNGQTVCKKDTHICMIEGMTSPGTKVITGIRTVSDAMMHITNLVYNALIYA